MSGGAFFFYLIMISSIHTFSIYLWLVGCFLFLAQWLEWKQAPYQFLRFLLERHQQYLKGKPQLDVTSVMIQPHFLIKDSLELMYRHKTHYFFVYTKRREIDHLIHEQEMLQQYFIHKNGYCTVRDTFG